MKNEKKNNFNFNITTTSPNQYKTSLSKYRNIVFARNLILLIH